MLTSLTIRNFKKFRDITIELGSTVVFIGPNNSGKTSALQALALWDVGIRLWNAKRGGKASPKKRPGVTINRRDLSSISIPGAKLLWRDLHVREGNPSDEAGETAVQSRTKNIRIDIEVAGVDDNKEWKCGLEFDFSNDEVFVCRPLRHPGFEDVPVNQASFTDIPDAASRVKVAYLPPMSGLSEHEFIKQPGEVGVLIGQGQTAQVLRNLCYQISSNEAMAATWGKIEKRISSLFGVTLLRPTLLHERSEIVMEYIKRGTKLDLSSSGRGLQQTLLLLAYLYANRNTVLLLDEPDAHLEILRQRQTYQLITDVAREQNSQIIAASHSEVVLNEAADRDVVVSFVGKPHRIDDRGHQTAKALKEIGFENYYQAEQRGWVLYLEGSTDLAILRAFAERLKHPVLEHLESPFVHFVCNQPSDVRKHFFGLREAKPDLVGIAIFDRLERELPKDLGVVAETWLRRELENYLCMPTVLMKFAETDAPGGLFAAPQRKLMEELIADRVPPIALRDPTDSWWINMKATDDFLDPLFADYYKKQNLQNLMRKSNYHELARFVAPGDIALEVAEKLDKIVAVAKTAHRLQE
jgi:AAA ATPase domain/AAA domain, putative AbiEii toxin, Type IV TA system